MRRGCLALSVCLLVPAVSTAEAGDDYYKAGWQAVMAPGGAGSSGTATILDENTIQIDCLNYNGSAPLVYLYLGVEDTYNSFLNGLSIGPELHESVCESLIVDLPGSATMDDWNAISIWCEAANVNFTSAEFSPGPCPADITGDDVVDVQDLVLVVLNFGAAGGPGDVNGDGIVDVVDIVDLILSWGSCF